MMTITASVTSEDIDSDEAPARRWSRPSRRTQRSEAIRESAGYTRKRTRTRGRR